jgi:hypothetical protein
MPKSEGKVGLGTIVLSFLIALLAEVIPINVYQQVWVNVLGLPIIYLGYTFIGVIAVAGIGYFYVDSAKWKVNLIAVALFAGVDAVILLFYPDWFYTVFFASIISFILYKQNYR